MVTIKNTTPWSRMMVIRAEDWINKVPYHQSSFGRKVATEFVALLLLIAAFVRHPKRSYRRLKGHYQEPTRKTAPEMPKIRRIDGED